MGQGDMDALPLRFNVLVWNMAKCRGSQWQDDFLELVHQHQLLLLQEAGLSPVNLEIFDQHESFEWQLARSFWLRKKDLDTGVKTGCRSASLASSCWHSPVREPLIRTRKMLLQTIYPLQNGEQLMVLNAHAINFVRMRGFRRHIDQLAEAAAEHEGPLLLGGDFNTWHPARMRYLVDLSSELKLQEITIDRPRRFRHLGQHLDHVFARGLQPVAVRLCNTIRSSDHLPISLSLEKA